ncbi:MAG: 30S ribosomal protein S16 [Microgenomates group bacterium]|jgi:small subunit ribosomal protein S16
MPVKIRLMRIGAKKRPFYRIVAIDERKKRSGEYLDLLGTYNPLTNPKEIILKQDKIDEWIKKGAVLSDGYLRMTKQAPQKPPRAPKKEKKSADVSPQPSEKQEEKSKPVEADTKSPAEDAADTAEVAESAEAADSADSAEIVDNAEVAETEETK